MEAIFCLFEFEFGSPSDYQKAVLKVFLKDSLKVKGMRSSVNKGNYVCGKHGLKTRVLKEIVKNLFGSGVTFKFNHHTNAVSIRLIPQIGDSFYSFILCQIRNAGNKKRLVYLIRKFCHNNC